MGIMKSLRRAAGVGLVSALLLGPLSVGADAETFGYPHSGVPCIHSPYKTSGSGYWCKNYDWGTKRNKTSSTNTSRGYGYRNCTDYVAWKLQSLYVPSGKWMGLGHGGQWWEFASGKGVTVNGSPSVGSAAVKPATYKKKDGKKVIASYGHVAYVRAVDAQGRITVEEYNAKQDGTGGTRGPAKPSELGFTKFVHFERFAFVKQIVRWKDGTSWYVGTDHKRHWIPNGGVYECLRKKGAKVFNLSSTQLDAIPDAGRDWAKCS